MAVGDEAVLVVAEYRTDQPVKTTITYPVNETCEVRDLETDAVLTTLSPENPSFTVALPSDQRARLLHIVAPGSEYSPPLPFSLEPPPAHAKTQEAQLPVEQQATGVGNVQFRHEAFEEMLKTGIPERGTIHSHGARIGGKWIENVWTYWYATEGNEPDEWELKPMHWDMHSRYAKAWHGLFSPHLDEDGYRSPFATRDRVYTVRDDAFVPVAAIAFRNPFDQAVNVRLEGNIRVRKTEKGSDLFVFVRSPDGQTRTITSTRQAEALAWYGHTGAKKPDREYLRMNTDLDLQPDALLVFAGTIDAHTRAAVEGRNIFELFADNDRWGPMYRPRISILPAATQHSE
jgi:hypothetical protein